MHELLATAVIEARELVRDGAAEDVTIDQVELADVALQRPWDAWRSPAEIEALAVVAGLAVEYLDAARDLSDDPDAAALVSQLGYQPEQSVRTFYAGLAAAGRAG